MKKFFLFCAVSLFSLGSIAGESLLQLEKNDLLAPFSKENRKYVMIGGAITAVFIVFEEQISDELQPRIAEDKPLGKWSKLGDYSGRLIPNVLYALGMESFGLLNHDEKSQRRAELMVRASTSSMITTFLLKSAVREPRPNNPEDRASFPSGHSSAAFTFAAVVGAEHGIYWGLASYSLATLTAFSRMNDNKHELHDVIAGAAIGISYGLSIFNRMNADGPKANQQGNSVAAYFVPTEQLDGGSLGLAATF